ncbi:MAG: ribonuclease [Lachnospiraceae bacterium]|nr:ribonuclease [Lachnospiraceae bacterium]
METLLQYGAALVTIVGLLAFMVSLIVQVIKGIKWLEKIPTDILVFVISIGLSVAVFFAYMQYMQYAIVWYMIVAAVLIGFGVAYVAMFGWDKASKLWSRFYKNKIE